MAPASQVAWQCLVYLHLISAQQEPQNRSTLWPCSLATFPTVTRDNLIFGLPAAIEHLLGGDRGNKTQPQPQAALSLWGQEKFWKRTFALEIAMNSAHPGGLKASVHSLSLAGSLTQRRVGTAPSVLRHSLLWAESCSSQSCSFFF